jgi:carbon monoxide dehydrogenase subunit G
MTEIKSETVVISRSAEEVFNFLSDFNNFGKLMPGQVTNWKATVDQCSFTIQGMADISLYISEKQPFSLISYSSVNDSPFRFSINNHIESVDGNSTKAFFILVADLSPMLKMMAARPLENFVNLLVHKLRDIFVSD